MHLSISICKFLCRLSFHRHHELLTILRSTLFFESAQSCTPWVINDKTEACHALTGLKIDLITSISFYTTVLIVDINLTSDRCGTDLFRHFTVHHCKSCSEISHRFDIVVADIYDCRIFGECSNDILCAGNEVVIPICYRVAHLLRFFQFLIFDPKLSLGCMRFQNLPILTLDSFSSLWFRTSS